MFWDFVSLGPTPYGEPGGGSDGGVAGIFDANISLVLRLSEIWSLRFGYNSFWLTGS